MCNTKSVVHNPMHCYCYSWLAFNISISMSCLPQNNLIIFCQYTNSERVQIYKKNPNLFVVLFRLHSVLLQMKHLKSKQGSGRTLNQRWWYICHFFWLEQYLLFVGFFLILSNLVSLCEGEKSNIASF